MSTFSFKLFCQCLIFLLLYNSSCARGQVSVTRYTLKEYVNRYKSSTPNPGITRDTSLDHLPRETFVPFTRQGNLMLVQGSINGKSITMIFDTGAAGCLFSIEMLKSLGIKVPTNLPTIGVGGVGTSQQTKAWIMPADLKLGGIERHQFPIYLNSNALNFPLLGVNFTQGFEYTINTDANIIQFKLVNQDKSPANTEPKAPTSTRSSNQLPGSGRSAMSAPASMQELTCHLTSKAQITVDSSCHYVYTVPFAELNGAIIVMVNIDGKDCPMILDTGTNICLFSNEHIRQLGIAPHFSGRMLTAKGAVGYMKAPLCEFNEAQFGPIKDHLACLVSDQALLPRPLLGQNFFGKWQLTVDHTNHVVKFIHK